jgi:hypothetical protein
MLDRAFTFPLATGTPGLLPDLGRHQRIGLNETQPMLGVIASTASAAFTRAVTSRPDRAEPSEEIRTLGEGTLVCLADLRAMLGIIIARVQKGDLGVRVRRDASPPLGTALFADLLAGLRAGGCLTHSTMMHHGH